MTSTLSHSPSYCQASKKNPSFPYGVDSRIILPPDTATTEIYTILFVGSVKMCIRDRHPKIREEIAQALLEAEAANKRGNEGNGKK